MWVECETKKRTDESDTKYGEVTAAKGTNKNETVSTVMVTQETKVCAEDEVIRAVESYEINKLTVRIFCFTLCRVCWVYIELM